MKTARLIEMVLTLGFAAATALLGQTAPANDACNNALPLTSQALQVVTNMYYATELGDPTNTSVGPIYRGVWYTFSTTNSQRVSLTTCASDFDTRMVVYTGSCGAFTEAAANDNNGPYCGCNGGCQASLTFVSASTPTNYYVLVGAAGPAINFPTSATTLRILLDIQPAPFNDTCNNALPLTSQALQVVTNMYYATELGDPTNTSVGPIYRGVWYTFSTTNSQRVSLTTCASDFDTRMVVYTGSCGAFTEAAANDNNGPYCGCNGGCQASLTFVSASTPTNYYVLVGAAGPAINFPTSATTLRILLDIQPAPFNDTCNNALPLTSQALQVVTNMYYATELGDPATTSVGPIYRGVWYTFSTTNSQRVSLTTCASDFDTRMVVYTGSCGAFTEAAANDNNGPYCGCNGGCQASLTFVSASTPTNYYVLVGAAGPAINFPTSATTLRILLDIQPAPFNDTCNNALPLTSQVLQVVTNMYYATELGDPATTSVGPIYRGVWYTFSTTNSQRVSLTTCASDFDTRMVVYTGSCGAFTEAAANDNNGPYCGCNGGCQASLTFVSASTPTNYYVLVGAAGPAVNFPTSATTLRILLDIQPAPFNDTCNNALPLTSQALQVVTNMYYATELGDPTNTSVGPIYRGVWYTFSTTNSQRVSLTTCASDFDTRMVVYTGSCGAFTEAAANDNNGPYCGCNGGCQASLTFVSASTPTNYYVLVGAAGPAINFPTSATTLRILLDIQPAPFNDTCNNALPLTSQALQVVTNMYYATELGDPATTSVGTIYRGVWYTFSTTNSQRVSLTTCASDFDTRMVVYTGSCGAFTEAAANDNNGPYCGCNGGCQASLTFVSASTPTNYYVLVGAAGPAVNFPTSATTLRILLDIQPAPFNDTCNNALPLTSQALQVVTNMYYATELGDPATTSVGTIYRGVWYTFSTTNSQRVSLTTCASDFDTRMVVYTGSCGAFTEAAANDNNGPYCGCNGGCQASLTFVSASTPTNYYVLVGAAGPAVNFPTSATTLRILLDIQPAPFNDTCNNALPLTSGVMQVVTNIFYATEVGDPPTNCAGSIYRGVWYMVMPPAGARFTVSTCGSDYDTVLSVYTNTCGSLSNLFCNNDNGPACSGNNASVNVTDVGGQTYFILASANGPSINSPTANTTLRIVATIGAPGNDACSNAIPLTAGVAYTVNNLNATELGDPTNCVAGFSRGTWFTYLPSVSGPIGVSTCGSDSALDTGLAVYSGSCTSLTNINCNDDNGPICSGNKASLNFPGVAGTTYYLLAGTKNGTAGNLQVLVTAIDLVATNLFATNSAGGLATAGRDLNWGWTVLNQGTNSIASSWTDRLILSNSVTNIVISLSSGAHNAPAGLSYSYSGTWNLGAIPAGTYTLLAQTDVGDTVAELNKLNNLQTLSIVVTNLPPAITLWSPTNQTVRETCVAVPFLLSAQTQAGSYTITNVTYYDGTVDNVIGHSTKAPYLTNSFALGFGTHIIGAQAMDNFGLAGTSAPLATITLQYPTNLNVLRADLATNGDFVGCMCANSGSNYVVESTTNLFSPTAWLPYATNQAVANVLAFTNHPVAPKRFFRARRSP